MLTQESAIDVQDLVVRSQTGDEVAVTKLYDMLYPRVYGYIYRRVFDAASAEDITSNVFYTIITKLHTFSWRYESGFYAWVFRVALNEVNDFFHAANRVVLKEEWLDFDDAGTEAEHISRSLDLQIAVNDLRQALAHLDDKSRTVVELRYFAGLDYAAIAQTIGKREGNVRVMIHRAIESLRKDIHLNRGKELS